MPATSEKVAASHCSPTRLLVDSGECRVELGWRGLGGLGVAANALTRS